MIMKKFLIVLGANKWEIAGILLMTAGAECLRIAGYKQRIIAEAESIVKEAKE
jgi:uncharacterized membrane protein